MEYWRPVYGHPAWPSTTPSLRVVDRFAYPAGEDADGTRMEPWYRLSAGLVYRADGHPDGASSTAELKVVGNFIYPIAGPDRGPWFQIADRT